MDINYYGYPERYFIGLPAITSPWLAEHLMTVIGWIVNER